jgi:hypothetical protein
VIVRVAECQLVASTTPEVLTQTSFRASTARRARVSSPR